MRHDGARFFGFVFLLGIVIPPAMELKDIRGGRIIYKVKVSDLLGRKAKRLK